VKALALTGDGTLWIGTTTGLEQIDSAGRWRTYRDSNTPESLGASSISSLALSPDDALWVGTTRGLGQLRKNGDWHAYTRTNASVGLAVDEIMALAVDASGLLWIGTFGGGLSRLDENGYWETFRRVNSLRGLSVDLVLSLAPAADGNLWFGAAGAGLARLQRGDGMQSYTTVNTGGHLKNWGFLTALVVDIDGTLWAGSSEGLARMDKNGNWETYTTANTHCSLSAEKELQLVLATDHALWVGTPGSIARLAADGRWQTYARADLACNPPGDQVTALAPDSNGGVWVGTFRGGLFHLDKEGHWRTYAQANTAGGLQEENPSGPAAVTQRRELLVSLSESMVRIDGFPASVEALASGIGGSVWVATGDGTISRLDSDNHWRTYPTDDTKDGRLRDQIHAMASGADGTLWVATEGGLARLDQDGHWQTYTTVNTAGGLPDDSVHALAFGLDGALWVGTASGIARLGRPPTPTHEIVDVIGNFNNITQPEQTFAVSVFDHSQLTQPGMFHYVWRLTEHGSLGDRRGPEIRTKSPIYTLHFKHDGTYELSIVAIDRYGMWSKPYEARFRVAMPKPDPILRKAVTAVTWVGSTTVIYFLITFPLLFLYPYFSWARTFIGSGAFTKFPLLHKTVLGTRWARRRIFRNYAAHALATVVQQKPYIPQSLFAERATETRALIPDGSHQGLEHLFAAQRRALLIARSGTGKSVLLRHLACDASDRFLRGAHVPLPVLIDLRTNALSGRAIQDLICDVLRGGGVELTDSDLYFLLDKGDFLILIDSLNELPDPADVNRVHTYLNRDAHNRNLIASQFDQIRRDDVSTFNLAEITPEQAARYLKEATGSDIYPKLPPEARALARNPQDLTLLARIAASTGAAQVPIHRADLYRTILDEDGSLQPWVESNDPRLLTLYALCFRMIAEQRVLQEYQLRDWIAAEPNISSNSVSTVIKAIHASRLFSHETDHGVLGSERALIGFRHELIGKFLAARHLRRLIESGATPATINYVKLSGDASWLEVFYFVIDEIGSPGPLNWLLTEVLAAGGPVRTRVAAYAIGTKPPEHIDTGVRSAYVNAKLAEDLARTPAS
jgi:ligand-binding sensor domain-containing protein